MLLKINSSYINVILIALMISCTESSNSIITKEKEIKPTPYFSFSEVDHYYIKISEDEVWDLYEKEGSEIEQLNSILTINYPKRINDTTFIDSLEYHGFVKKEIPTDKHESLDNIFSEKKHKDSYMMMCLPIYRDILIFKKTKKIVGIAKICFSCEQSHILGTDANTTEFGMSGDFNKLYKLLYE